jgi:hypothetical protein
VLTAQEAAAYFQLPVKQFERLGIGRLCFGARVLYDREALDAHLDQLSGLDSRQASTPQDDAEAALARFSAHLDNAPRRAPGS